MTAAGERTDGRADGLDRLMDDEWEECVTHEPCLCVEACVPDIELALYLLDHVDIRLWYTRLNKIISLREIALDHP